jgi:hypothetical protein
MFGGSLELGVWSLDLLMRVIGCENLWVKESREVAKP